MCCCDCPRNGIQCVFVIEENGISTRLNRVLRIRDSSVSCKHELEQRVFVVKTYSLSPVITVSYLCPFCVQQLRDNLSLSGVYKRRSVPTVWQ